MRRGRIWLDMAHVTDAERVASRKIWSDGLDEFRTAESANYIKQFYWGRPITEVSGTVVRYGNPELPEVIDLLSTAAWISNEVSIGSTTAAEVLQSHVFRVIVPGGFYCDTRLIDGVGIPRTPCSDPAYEVTAWDGEPPKMLGWPDKAYYLVLPQGLLQVLSITRP